MGFLRDFFQIKLKYFLPIFIVLYIVIYYLSTKFLITDDLLLSNFDEVKTIEDLEGGHTFFNLFFGFTMVKSLLSIFFKAIILSVFLGLILNCKISSIFKVVILSSSVYIIARAFQFIVFGLYEPEKIKTLETNIFSIYALINHTKYGSFVQKLTYNISLTEVVFIAMLISGLFLLNNNLLLKKIISSVVVGDLVYIILSALI